MICSAQTAKSGSNWLHRLRSNKGIPTGDHPDLDSFLLTVHSQSPQARPAPNPPSLTQAPPQPKSKPMSTLLAELFRGATLTIQKCPRKQTNPKIFLLASSNATSTSTTVPAASSTPSVSPRSDAAVPEVEEEVAADRGDDEDANELKGFTKSEVTVIDTSCPGWKVDKFVFRKNNVWKVRERKPKKNKFFAKRKSNNSTTLNHRHVDLNAIETSKDIEINMRGEKPVKTQKEASEGREWQEIDVTRLSSKKSRKENTCHCNNSHRIVKEQRKRTKFNKRRVRK